MAGDSVQDLQGWFWFLCTIAFSQSPSSLLIPPLFPMLLRMLQHSSSSYMSCHGIASCFVLPPPTVSFCHMPSFSFKPVSLPGLSPLSILTMLHSHATTLLLCLSLSLCFSWEDRTLLLLWTWMGGVFLPVISTITAFCKTLPHDGWHDDDRR